MKMHSAKVNNSPSVEIWGTGTPKREFLYVDDLAHACIFLMNSYNGDDFVNIGTGSDITIRELAQLIVDIVGYKGELIFNTSMPDGTPRKLLDISKLHSLGWKYRTDLNDGIRQTYKWFLENRAC
jgi:GDP-L-fucose synthase